jgi:Glycosyl hydrolase family 79, N-terminal domain
MHAYPMRYKWYRPAIVALLCVTYGIGTLLYQRYTSPRAELYQTPEFHGATITVDTSGKIIGEINNQYIGLSFESDTLNSGEFDNVGNLAQLLRNLGNSVMRFGGNSVDKSFQGITPSALAGLTRLAKASGWTVLYSENLGQFNAATTSEDAKTVSAALGSSLSAFACGNEPNQYGSKGVRMRPYTETEYLNDVARCFAAIHTGAPNALLEGPDSVAAPTWLAEYAKKEAGTLSWLGFHYYPLGCGLDGMSPAQAASNLLSPGLAAEEASTFTQAAADAKTAGAQLWMTETQSACGGGAQGLSDSYATALWVVDYLLTGAEHGVNGMNFHGGFNIGCETYTPLCQVGTDEYSARPIYYGMLFTHLLGDGHLLPVAVSSARNVAAFALKPQSGGGLRLIVENLNPYQIDATLRVGGNHGTITVLHMTGPSLLATSGVKIEDAMVGATGRINPGRPNTVHCTSGNCPVPVAPYSAVLVTVG